MTRSIDVYFRWPDYTQLRSLQIYFPSTARTVPCPSLIEKHALLADLLLPATMLSTMMIGHLRRWSGNLNKVEVRRVITMIAVEK
jgi:hypothetical protein